MTAAAASQPPSQPLARDLMPGVAFGPLNVTVFDPHPELDQTGAELTQVTFAARAGSKPLKSQDGKVISDKVVTETQAWIKQTTESDSLLRSQAILRQD